MTAYKETLRITYDASSRDPLDSNTQPIEVASLSMLIKFEGHDATKNRKDFLLTAQSEIKKNKEKRRPKRGG